MNRFVDLLFKLWSVKGLFVILATVGLFTGKLSEITFTLAWATFVGSRELWKHLKGENNAEQTKKPDLPPQK